MKNAIIIDGSARIAGHTQMITDQLTEQGFIDNVKLVNYIINHYQYDQDPNDDFQLLIDYLLNFDVWIVATPVYWYSMSGRTKVFFDRLTDLLKTYEHKGQLLKGKAMASVSCGSETLLNQGFELPFQLSAEYLGMHYLGHLHTWVTDGNIESKLSRKIAEFKSDIIQKMISEAFHLPS